MSEVITVEEAAARLGVSEATVKRHCRAGTIKASKLGRSWLVDLAALPRPPRVPSRTRRPAAASKLLNLSATLQHLQSHDLKRDVWVPDVLLHQDDLLDAQTLLDAVATRIDDPAQAFDPPTFVAVPKSPFFPRNATNLTLVDRLAYHASVLSFAHLLDAKLSDNVYSARLAGGGTYFLKNGRDAWVSWRDQVLTCIGTKQVWVAETDITSFFDFIKHELLLPEVQAVGADPRIVLRLREMLRTWTVTPNTGLPQGPDASRVLANFYMAPVDEAMELLAGVRYLRFMDDIRIIGERRSDVVRALHALDNECRRRGLALSTKKTEIRKAAEARAALEDRELDQVQYAFDLRDENPDEVRQRLKRLFERALGRDGHINKRHATFSLWRLFQTRDRSVLMRVLDHLESVSILGWLVPAYISPWLRTTSVQRKVTAYLTNPERNLSAYMSTWLMAAMLDIPDALAPEWINYARSVAFDREQPAFHRAVALNVLAIGRSTRDIARVEEAVGTEHDPEVVRACCVALFRIGRLSKATCDRASRLRGLGATIAYLRGRQTLPSLVFPTQQIRVRQ